MAADEVTALRLRLLELGYSPIPLFGKEPPIYGKNNQRKGLGNWQQLDGVTCKQIEMWSKTWPDATNTGALTRLMPTLDLDILNEAAARAIEDYVREHYEKRGYILPRIGKPPKRAIPFRTEEPFSKIVANVVAPNGSAEKLEFLGDGQQVVVAGIHPETKQPYRWFGGEPGQIAREDLPYIREQEAHEVVAAALEILVRDFGYTRAPERPHKQRTGTGQDTDTGGGAADWQWLFDNIRAGRELHDSLRDLAAKLIASGTSAGAVVNQLRALMEGSSAPKDDRWKERYAEIPRLVDSAEQYRIDEAKDDDGEGAASSLVRVNLARYDSESVPPREWGVPDRFPRRAVCLLSGEGGRGKSITLLQLAAAHVLVKDWLRSLPEPGPVVLVNAEDEEGEIIRRLKPIVEHYGASFADLARDLHIFSLASADPLLALPDRSGRIIATSLYAELMTLVRAVQPVCTIIDNVADVFGANEIERSHVRQFIALMRQFAIAGNGYVIMSSHPSLTGLASKTGLSGSTQWHNAVRARAWLHGGEANNGETPDPDLRVLEFLKSNYSRLAETVTLRWQNGLYVPVSRQGFLDEAAAHAATNDLFLTLLDRLARNNRRVSEKRTANNYAPTVFAAEPEAKAKHITRPAFEDAMRRLFAAEQIALVPYGPASRDYHCIVRKASQ
jgi:RecA-family ATPase